MAHAHFISIRKPDGEPALVRADRADIIELVDGQIVLRTPSGSVQADGATLATITKDLQSAQITVVAINNSTAPPKAVEATPAQPQQPARQAVVRAPQPDNADVQMVDDGAGGYTTPSGSGSPPKKVVRKVATD